MSDERKLELDEKRLDFEVKKHEEERDLRAATLAKTLEDLRAARRPFYANPAYLTPLATICVALLGGFFAFGTNWLNSNISALKAQQSRIAAQNVTLEEEQGKLKTDNDRLIQNTAKLQATNKTLAQQRAGLTSQVAGAKGQISALEGERDSLVKKMPTERVEAALRILREETYFGMPAVDDPSAHLLFRLVGEHKNEPDVRALVEKEYDAPTAPRRYRIVLASMFHALYGGDQWNKTSLDGVQGEVLKTCSQGAVSELTFQQLQREMGWLLSNNARFSREEKSQLLEHIYIPCKQSFARSAIEEGRLAELAALWDAEASTQYRQPWLDAWNFAADADTAVFHLSPQGEAVRAMMTVANSSEVRPQDRVPIALTMNCNFPADVPLCADVLVDAKPKGLHFAEEGDRLLIFGADRKPVYQEWLAKNAKLVSLFAKGNRGQFGKLPDDVFQDIVLKRWVRNERVLE